MEHDAFRPAFHRGSVLPSSFLYVPADRPDLCVKARDLDTAVIVDLEDAVAPAHKETARQEVVAQLTQSPSPAKFWLRIDPSAGPSDREVVRAVRGAIAGVMIAKAEPDCVEEFVRDLVDVPFIALIESARGLDSLDEIAEQSSLVTFAIGEVDLLADLRIRRGESTRHVIDMLRLQVVQAARRNGLSAPIAPTSTDFTDMDAFAESTQHLRDMGFRSRTAIHPRQCPVIHAAFTPSAEEITDAKDIISRFESEGGGVALDARGRLIDAAVIRDAAEILVRHQPQEGAH